MPCLWKGLWPSCPVSLHPPDTRGLTFDQECLPPKWHKHTTHLLSNSSYVSHIFSSPSTTSRPSTTQPSHKVETVRRDTCLSSPLAHRPRCVCPSLHFLFSCTISRHCTVQLLTGSTSSFTTQTYPSLLQDRRHFPFHHIFPLPSQSTSSSTPFFPQAPHTSPIKILRKHGPQCHILHHPYQHE